VSFFFDPASKSNPAVTMASSSDNVSQAEKQAGTPTNDINDNIDRPQ